MKKRTLVYQLLTVICISFTLLFYGPLGLYLSNSEELWFDIGTVLKIVFIVSLICTLLLLLLLWLFNHFKQGILFHKILFGLSLALYLQGTFINISYGTGVMDGTYIDWKSYSGYAIFNTIIWVICLIVPFIISIPLKEKTSSILGVISAVIIGMQIPALLIQIINYTPNANADLVVTDEGASTFGSEDNIIIFALDTMDEEYYQEYISEHPEYTSNLEGFIHYENTLAAGARTMIAVPAILTGRPYKKDDTYSSYLRKVWGDSNPLALLHERNYDVRCYLANNYFADCTADYIDNFDTGSNLVGSQTILAKKLYKLTFFTYFPHFLKPSFEMDTSEFDEAKVTDNRYTDGDVKFYNNYIVNGASVSDQTKKAFRFYLLIGAHAPYTMTSDVTRSKGKTSLKEQVEGSFKITKDFLNNLKEIGVFDSSTIIITADHGDYHVAERPFMLIHFPGDTKPYRTSSAPVSQFDIANTICEHINAEVPFSEYGRSIASLKENEKRTRSFFYNTTGNSHVVIDEYATDGKASEQEKLLLVTRHEDSLGSDTPYELGTVLTFDMDATANRYAMEGFGNTSGFRTVLRGPHSSMQIPIENLPKEGKIVISLSLHSIVDTPTRTVISANNVVVFDNKIDEKYAGRTIEFSLDVDSFSDDNILYLNLDFPDIPEEEMEKGIGSRTKTISFTQMCITRE